MCRLAGVPIQYLMFITWLWGSFMANLFKEEAPKGYERAKHTSGHVISGLYNILTDNDRSNARSFDPEFFVNCIRDKRVS